MSIEELSASPQSLDQSRPSENMASPKVDDSQDRPIVTPNENDVLCGRGGSINSHKGNEQFREFVEKRKRVYLTARFKREKRLIASSIVSEIRAMNPPGRFLARKGNKDTGFWYDIGDEKARDKASQALRENAPSIRAEIETEIHEQRAEMQRHETEDNAESAPPCEVSTQAHPYFQHPAPPLHHPSYQAYWDWYHHHYGYPPTVQPPSHYPPPPIPAALAPAIPSVASSQPQPHAPHPAYWGHSVIPAAHERTVEEFKDDRGLDLVMSQEEEDHRLAQQLQQEEKVALYESRRERYKHSLARRSNAHLGTAARSPAPAVSHVRRPPPTASMSAPYERMEPAGLFQQEDHDFRVALALQENEREEAMRSRSTKTSRSMAFPQFNRSPGIFSDQSLSESFMAWINNDSKRKAEPRRSVQFEEDDTMGSHFSQSVGTLQGEPSSASVDRPLQPQSQQNRGLLFQAAKGIIGWDSNHQDLPTSGTQYHLQEDMETEGLEVQLRDPHEETTMPPPDPRVQTEWSSRSIHSWIPDHFHTNWAPGDRDHSLSGHLVGISPSASLEMETSANAASIGGGSLCQLFERDESLQRALRSMPSWEHGIRSKSPTSFHDHSDKSTQIRVRELKLFRAPPAPPIQPSTSVDMDWDG